MEIPWCTTSPESNKPIIVHCMSVLKFPKCLVSNIIGILRIHEIFPIGTSFPDNRVLLKQVICAGGFEFSVGAMVFSVGAAVFSADG